MAPPYPSIQSFYKREVPVPVPKSTTATTGQGHATSSTVKLGDGYTEDEVAEALDPLARKWNPSREYEERGINELTTGPKAVTFLGRIVNFNTVYGSSRKQPKASGWHYMLIKDDEACISVKLYFAAKPYPFKLGQLLTIWTAFIADASKADSNHAVTSMTANMFPARVTSDHIMVHTPSTTLDISDTCRRPLACTPHGPLPGLMSLESYLTTGHDGVTGVKILVCVKSIGARKKLAKKGGGECELAEVMLFDHTAEAKLKLWGEMIDSAQDWIPSETILLVSNPGFRAEYGGKGSVGIQMPTMVDVDPEFPDAKWLRGFAASLTKKESLGTEFPEGVFDIDAAEHGINKILFTIADVDEWARSSPSAIFTGYLSLILTEISLVRLRARNMLLCNTCCGLPLYSNKPCIPCPHCLKPATLTLNSKIVGKCIDETGCVASGKFLWCPKAWEELLGRGLDEVAAMSAAEIQSLEQRLLWLRVTFVFGWAESVGRLAVLGVTM
ncbi:hypothetical protein BP5796_04401 [Coleophoma crateriformis]|uniref:Uncharacterized protein n=1 Tax=Coleophoma crateriformis TaxID=565419 RepID=A0A3D8S9I6_9HELO|nr:hypothetical protein BP5796_04401 [Coleophoma crateriformis]